jgi:dipeptidase D
MVVVKNPGSSHDFETDPIDLIVEGNWVRANGTTLGADNGCAVAIMLALLDDDSLPHPPLECLFAAQEEPGMLGIKEFDLNQIRARRGIGLDAGSEGVFRKGVSSKYTDRFRMDIDRVPADGIRYELIVSGFLGGPASAAIPLDRGCAIKQCARMLHRLKKEHEIRLVSVDKRMNPGVAEDCEALFVLVNGDPGNMLSDLNDEFEKIKAEYRESEPNIQFELNSSTGTREPMSKAGTERVIDALYLSPYGAERRVIERQNEPRCYAITSTVSTEENNIEFDTLISSDLSFIGIAKREEVKTLLALLGAVSVEDGYEFGWDPEDRSEIRDTLREAYVREFGKEPIINVSHGFNDCVIIKQSIPSFDVVTTAATYLDYHTTNERLDLQSFEKVYRLVCAALRKLKHT